MFGVVMATRPMSDNCLAIGQPPTPTTATALELLLTYYHSPSSPIHHAVKHDPEYCSALAPSLDEPEPHLATRPDAHPSLNRTIRALKGPGPDRSLAVYTSELRSPTRSSLVDSHGAVTLNHALFAPLAPLPVSVPRNEPPSLGIWTL